MKTIVVALAFLPALACASSQKLTAVGMKKTNLEYVWSISLKEADWSGRLDCQSFIHTLTFKTPKLELLNYVDPKECDEWRERLQDARPSRPVCVTVDQSTHPRPSDC